MVDFTPAILLHVSRRARRLDECLEAARSRDRGESGSGETSEILRLWRHAYSLGEPEAWKARLGWDGLDEDLVENALTDVRSVGPADPVPWTVWLERGSRSRTEDLLELPPIHHPGQVPFPEIWMPFVVAVRTELARVVDPMEWMSASSYAELEAHLLHQLAETGGQVVWQEYRNRMAGWKPRKDPAGGIGNERYLEFITWMQDGGLADLLSGFPVLARQACELTDGWFRRVVEFLERLDRDLPSLAEEMDGGAPLGKIVAVEPGLSDRHQGGRQVMALTFNSGLRVVYKPRSVALESAYSGLLFWLCARGLEVTPGALRVVAGDDYGWLLFVDRASFDKEKALRDYFRRAGSLLCLAHLLGANDLHMENVIAGREGPCLVDCETLLQPQLVEAAVPRGEARGSPSCLSTGLVSFSQVSAEGTVFDVSGLCGHGGVAGAMRHQAWLDSGTDRIRPTETVKESSRAANLPLFEGEPQDPGRFFGEVREGFRATWRFLKQQRAALLASDGPMSLFAGLRTRLVLRPSAMYAAILMQLRTPKLQRRGVDGGILVDSLNRVFAGATDRPILWSLTRPERRSLEGLDVPRFTADTDSPWVFSEDSEGVVDAVRKTGLELAVERLRRLDESGLEEQIGLLEDCLLGSSPAAGGRHEGLIDRARIIAHRLIELIHSDDAFASSDLDLYRGSAGVALGLAALGRVLGDREIRESAIVAFAPARQALRSGRLDRLAPDGAVGACTGLGGIAFALAWGGVHLEEPDVIDDSLRAAQAITQSMIAGDRRLDVEGGVAGAIFGLLAVHAITGDGGLLERCRWCADRLLASQETSPEGGAGWPSADGPMLAGFAHGASGVATALLRLHQVQPDSRLLDAARAGFLFERGLYSPEQRNWWVPGASVGGDGRIFMTAWCHGAPGIALARMEAMRAMSDRSLQEDLDVALGTILVAPLSGPHHLCCGTLGRTDILLKGGHRLERRELLTSALYRVDAIVADVDRMNTDPATVESIGLFSGLAGVAYGLVRAARPFSLPSLLSFDPPAGRESC
ncbi:MAG: type 2 lanthipeptide synthetase LanM family protein [Thermoanaerobaculales bacterium]